MNTIACYIGAVVLVAGVILAVICLLVYIWIQIEEYIRAN